MKTKRLFIFILMAFRLRVAINFLLLFLVVGCGKNLLFGQTQGFEEAFDIVNHPEEFLPFWSANEVRASAARVFQAEGKGRNGGKALGIQAISTFDAVLYSRVESRQIGNSKLAFFARTETNGTGDRPVILSLSFSKSGSEPFLEKIPVGDMASFPNRNSPYTLFEVTIPAPFQQEENFSIKWEITVGPGTGSAARLFLDDVGLFGVDELVDPVQIQQVTILNPYWVEIVVDRSLAKVHPTQVSLGGDSPFTVLQPADTLLWLESAESITDPSLEIELSEIEELGGKTTPELSVAISNLETNLGRIVPISPDKLSVEFSHPFEPASVSQTDKWRVNGIAPSDIQLLEDGFSVMLTLTGPLPAGSVFQLECSDIVSNLTGTVSPRLAKEVKYLDGIERLYMTDRRTIFLEYRAPLLQEFANKHLFQIQDNPELTFELDFLDPITVRLIANQEIEAERLYFLDIPPVVTGSGFIFPGLQKPVVWDVSAPELTHVTAVKPDVLLLVFSEDLDPVFSLASEVYQINGDFPRSVEIPAKANRILSTWDQTFTDQSPYEIKVSGIFDLHGNQNVLQIFEFVFQKPTTNSFKSLVINEVMPAPKAGNSLPNAEYVELYNASDSPIFLGGMQLANSRRQSQMPSYVLEAGELLILCSRIHVGLFEKYGPVLGLSNWPSLLNAGDRIKVIDTEGFVLDSLTYSTSTFGGSSQANGAFSLEIVNPYLVCNLPSNLKPSQNSDKGTPGRTNSVLDPTPDLSPLKFLEGRAIADRRVLLKFNKILSSDLTSVNVGIKPTLRINGKRIGEAPDELILDLVDSIAENTKYILSIQNLRDCTGNEIVSDTEVFFVRPALAAAGDLVINEVLFNPRSGEPKFVEVYNASEKYINLKDWKLANLGQDGSIANRKLLVQQDYILAPRTFLVFTDSKESLKQAYPKGVESQFVEVSLPSYPIGEGNVVWLDPGEDVVEAFAYRESMHHKMLKEKKGVSLERSSPWIGVDDPNNWKSASSTEGFATPGYRNSTAFEHGGNFGISVEPKVFAPDGIGEQQYTTISYSMARAGFSATVNVFSTGGQLVKEICQNALWGETGIYTWDGTNQSGERVRPGYYVVWVEIFDLEGRTHQVKKTVVVGTKF